MSYYGKMLKDGKTAKDTKKAKETKTVHDWYPHCYECVFGLASAAAGQGNLWCVKKESIQPQTGSCREGKKKGLSYR